MKIHDCKQGDGIWLGLRGGMPTASRADCLITPTGKPVSGAKRVGYLHELAAEAITGTVEMHFVTAAMERGTQLEPEARNWYELTTGSNVQQVGFVESDCGRWGCSPDGLVGDDGGIEIKCPERKQYIRCLIEDKVPAEYLPQIQFCMWVCNRKWWDWVLYTDEAMFPYVVRRVERNAQFMDSLDEIVPAFCDELDAIVQRVKGMKQ